MSKSLKTGLDKFTSLPEDVANDKVLALLSMEDISRLSVVSRRCRQLCISTPFLNVDVTPYLNNAAKRTRLMNYVDRLFSLRRGMAIQRFTVCWCLDQSGLNNGSEEEYRVISWLHNALMCNVKKLVLVLRPKTGSILRAWDFALPPSLLCSTSLKFLAIYGISKLPSFSSIGFSSLTVLKLCTVRLDESFSDWVSTRCKFLQTLYLQSIKETKSIVINSSCITELYISSMDHELCHIQVSAGMLERMTLCWLFDTRNDRRLHLSVPQLQMFFWRGNILRLPLTENLASLKSAANIFLASASTLTSRNMVRVFYDFRHFNSRILFDKNLQDYESTKYCDGQNGKTLAQNLKFVTIELFSQAKNEFEMIKYLLKNAEYLQRMTILYAPPLGSDVVGEIRGHEKASKAAVVEFHPM
ncbi:LRR-domain containing protein [Parasponia andersonii]|uniref:LRR-domain containing protein n=1 Tax=Parasponia andersonii TaxID=3476 RepID=A0A2P5BU23_PARAD|nr:LRR-domain containing protein [Parasponia andersonii]